MLSAPLKILSFVNTGVPVQVRPGAPRLKIASQRNASNPRLERVSGRFAQSVIFGFSEFLDLRILLKLPAESIKVWVGDTKVTPLLTDSKSNFRALISVSQLIGKIGNWLND